MYLEITKTIRKKRAEESGLEEISEENYVTYEEYSENILENLENDD